MPNYVLYFYSSHLQLWEKPVSDARFCHFLTHFLTHPVKVAIFRHFQSFLVKIAPFCQMS